MPTKTLIAVALATTAFLVGPALAQYPSDGRRLYTGQRAEQNWGPPANGDGAYWYCPAGTAPQPFPNGEGYRCQTVGANW